MVGLFGQRETEQERRDELLSAYVDDQLSADERAGLEAQLAIDPELRDELDALRQTVALVRDLPPVPVPHNFILPQTAAARPRPARQAPLRRAWAAPFLTAASAVFGLLFAIVLAGDLLLSGVGGMASAPMPQELVAREMEMPQEPPAPAFDDQGIVVTVQTEAEVVVEAEVETEAAEFGKAVSVPSPSPVAMEVPPAAMLAVTPESPGLVAETEETEEAADTASGGGGPPEEPVAPTSAPAPSLVATDAAEDTRATLATETPIPGTNAGVPEPAPSPGEARKATPWTIAEGEAMEEAAGAAPEELEQGTGDTRFTPILPWRALEVVLGLISLGLIGVTIWAWRVRRR
jgi:anti-sigma factor RsiW